MDTEVEYRSLWKMSLGQVTGSLAMVALGIVDVTIKAEKCSGGHHTYMPGFCLAMAIWLPAFLLLIALLTFSIGPEKGGNHDKLILINIGCCLLGILLCLALVGWSILNISHTVDLEMPTEKGYSTIVVPCFVIPLSVVVAIFSVFNMKSAFKLLRIRAERKIKPGKIRTQDGETIRVIDTIPWWQKMGRQSVSVHSSLVSRSIQSFHSEASYDCEHTPGGHCSTCDNNVGRSLSASVLERSHRASFRPSSIPAIFGLPDSVCDFQQESIYESIDPSRDPSSWLFDNHHRTHNKPPKLPMRNDKRRIDPNIIPLKPIVHRHKFQNSIAPDRRKKSAQAHQRQGAAPPIGTHRNKRKPNDFDDSEDEIFAISGRQKYPRPISKVHSLRQHPAGRKQTTAGHSRAPSGVKRSPHRSNIKHQHSAKASNRRSQTLSNSITIIM